MPLMISSPDSSASMSEGTQLSPITPPAFATPMTSAFAPRARASLGDRLGRPAVTVAPAHDHSPTQRSAAQSLRPNAVLAYPGSVVSPRNSKYGCGSSPTP